MKQLNLTFSDQVIRTIFASTPFIPVDEVARMSGRSVDEIKKIVDLDSIDEYNKQMQEVFDSFK